MITHSKESRVLFIMSKYALIQILFGSACIFAVQTNIDIAWFFLVLLIGSGTLVGLIPYIASRIVQRRTKLGYVFSRNGVMILHAGIGMSFILYLTEVREWYAYLFPIFAILYASGVIHVAFRERRKNQLCVIREGS